MSHLSTLYFDKPLNAHTLMQAIARTNRVHVVKNSGVVADYCGILISADSNSVLKVFVTKKLHSTVCPFCLSR